MIHSVKCVFYLREFGLFIKIQNGGMPAVLCSPGVRKIVQFVNLGCFFSDQINNQCRVDIYLLKSTIRKVFRLL